MTDINNPEVGTEVSTLPADSAVDNVLNVNLDSALEGAFNDAMQGILDDLPSAEEEQPEEGFEVSEDNENSPSDDDTHIDEDEEQEEVESEEEDTSDSVVDWNEMKQHSFEIDGKTYSANDLKAALGRQSKQEESRNEVETARKELEAERTAFEAERKQVRTQDSVSQGRQQLTILQQAYAQLKQQEQEAINNNDAQAFQELQMKVRPLEQQYAQLEQQVQAQEAESAQNAAKALEKYGFGDLNTDGQRAQAFKEYALKSIPQHLVPIVNTNSELLAMVEKARLYDKANSEIPKGKLKGNRKTLKKGAVKSTKSKPVDKLSETVDSVIEDMFKDF